MGSTVDETSTSSTGTVPPPSRPRLGDRNSSEWSFNSSTSPGTTRMPSSYAGPTGRSRLHRPSALSLSDQGSGASSARILLGTSLPSGTSLKRRQDNWQGLRDMMEDEEEDVSDTETIRPDSRGRERDAARRSTSIQSLRSLFTSRSSDTAQAGRARPWSIAGVTEDEEPIASGLLSSSPPQMNGFTDGIEETLDRVRQDSSATLKTKHIDTHDVESPYGQNGREEDQPLLPQATSIRRAETKQKGECPYALRPA